MRRIKGLCMSTPRSIGVKKCYGVGSARKHVPALVALSLGLFCHGAQARLQPKPIIPPTRAFFGKFAENSGSAWKGLRKIDPFAPITALKWYVIKSIGVKVFQIISLYAAYHVLRKGGVKTAQYLNRKGGEQRARQKARSFPGTGQRLG